MTSKKERYQQQLRTPGILLRATRSKGRHVVASESLPKGTLVVSEDAAAFVLLKASMDELCLRCVRPLDEGDSKDQQQSLFGSAGNSKGVVCKGCIKQTYYCSSECMDSDHERHSLECEVVRHLPGITAMHSTDYALMRLVLGVLVNRHLETVATMPSTRTPTEFVFDLVSHRKTCDPKWLACVEACADDFAQYLPEHLSIPASEIVTLACRINSNSHAMVDPTGNTNQEVGVGMFPMVAMLNHACAPNCSFVSTTHGRMIVRTLRDVEAGEELCVTYVDLCTPRSERRGKLLETKHFWCECERCSCLSGESEDAFLDAILCQECKSPSAYYSSKDGESTCTQCGSTITQEQLSLASFKAEQAHSDAHDLFKARHTDSALTAYAQFIQRFENTVLHPNHHLLISAYATMMNCAQRLRDYVSAIRYGSRVIQKMRPHVPSNWPELADFEFRMGELWEIVGMAVVEGIIAPSELESLANDGLIQVQSGAESCQEVGSYVVREHALRCFETCLSMRRVAYGEEHVRTIEAGEQVARLNVPIVAALLPSIILGQSRKRLTAALPETLPNAVLVAGLAGGIQAGVALALKVPSALEKAPEHKELVARSEKNFWPVFFSTILRKSAGFAVFFLIFDALKAKLAATKTPASKAARAAQNLAAATLAATFYRLTTWFIDGKLPALPSASEDGTDAEKVFGGRKGGNPYAAALEQIKGSVLKAAVPLVAMDLVLGRPSW
ncbi:hypothetical protein HDU80_000100 [Chytriomyces hyalinus]|nr:hypothetical protein HDU80_000100 [Chytriomyces hyalinus]